LRIVAGRFIDEDLVHQDAVGCRVRADIEPAEVERVNDLIAEFSSASVE